MNYLLEDWYSPAIPRLGSVVLRPHLAMSLPPRMILKRRFVTHCDEFIDSLDLSMIQMTSTLR